eukprot:jgi/Chrzof1/13370/Cz07g30150.t1
MGSSGSSQAANAGSNADTRPSEASSSKSALHANIEEKQDLAYYYAHREKDTGEAPAPPPVHVPIHQTTAETIVQYQTIFDYQFLDDGKVVKIYIPLEGVGNLASDCIKTNFTEMQMEVLIQNYKPKTVMRLAVKGLHSAIDPEQSKHRQLANKVVVTLSKKEDIRWSKLTR